MSKKELLKRIEALEMRCDCLIRQWEQDKHRLDRLTECYYKLENDANATIDEREDYDEERKKYWYINTMDNTVIKVDYTGDADYTKKDQEIGNYFETEEEAEEAMEKLKALKRLKDAGFKLTGYQPDDKYKYTIKAEISPDKWQVGVIGDLDLLFGGEE